MFTIIETIRIQYRINRLVRAMTRQGLSIQQAMGAIEHHAYRGTFALLEQEWLA